MKQSEGKVGMKVYFGRGNGEQTLGEIVKVNPKKFKVKQLETRGTRKSHAIGTVWTVPPSLCTPADTEATTTSFTPLVIDVTDVLKDALTDKKPDLTGMLNTTSSDPHKGVKDWMNDNLFCLADIQLACDIVTGDGGMRGEQVVEQLQAMRRRGEA